MRIKEHAGFVDSIEVRVFGPDGKLKRYHKLHNGRVHRFLVWIGLAHNTMTNVGFAECANLIGNVSSPTAFTDVGIGTGTNASAATNTQLQTSILIKAATVTRVQTTLANDTLQLVATFGIDADNLAGTYIITEIGVFNGTINGTSIMLLRQEYTSPVDTCVFAADGSGDTYQLTVKVKCLSS